MSDDSKHMVNDELLIKHILGECDTFEQEAIRAWFSDSDQNQLYYDALKKIWDISEDALTTNVDENLAWEKVSQEIEKTEIRVKTRHLLNRSLKVIARIAAVFIVAFGIYSLWPNKSDSIDFITITSADQVINDTLPDGSFYALNKNSVLIYEKTFKGNSRNVELSGEAFFKVKKNADKPFIVQTEFTDVTVLGTSFNVKAYENKNIVVTVKTGKVQVNSKNIGQTQTVLLEKDEVGFFELETEILMKEELDTEILYEWQENSIVFDRAQLSKVISQLSEVYETDIRLSNEELGDLTITVSFKDQSIEEILEIIAATLNLELKQIESYFEIFSDEY